MIEVACWFQHPLVRGAGVQQRIPTGQTGNTDDMLPKPVRKAVQLFSESFDDPISMTQVAEIVGLSSRQLERKFKQASGQSPIGFYRSKRMHAARQMVLYSGDSLSKIAYAVGYSSTVPLMKYYRQEFGVAPLEERKKINMFRVAENAPVPSV
jgi:transcriptional regulator GlxA family with amidase domain